MKLIKTYGDFLCESASHPDYLQADEINYVKNLYSSDRETLSFAYDLNTEEWVFGTDHDWSNSHRNTSTLYFYDEDEEDDIEIGKLEYFGRLWSISKYIIFWNYPSKELFEECIDNLEIRLDEKIWGDDWKIVVNELSGGDNIEVVPIEDYKVSTDFPEEERQIHLLNAKDKNKALKDMGAKPKIHNWKEWQKPFENKLYENPNILIYNDIRIDYLEGFPFSYFYDKFFHLYDDDVYGIGSDDIATHYDIYIDIFRNRKDLEEKTGKKFTEEKYEKDKKHYRERFRENISGRIFPKQKIITFWIFPKDNKEMKKVANDIKENMDIDIWDDWLVEILLDETKMTDDWGGNWGSWSPEEDAIFTDFIPVKDYKRSEERSEEELKKAHFMSGDEMKANGLKPKKPKGKVPAAYRSKSTRFKYTESFSDFGGGDSALYDNESGGKFWGNSAAGILVYCKSTKRFLLDLRSEEVNEPNTIGIFGGKIESDDNEKSTAKREFIEETGFVGDIDIYDAYIFYADGFVYYNFVGVIDHEFEPDLSWESKDYLWLNYEELLEIEPKHPGLKLLLDDNDSISIIKNNI